MSVTAPRRRLRSEDRREQLLDAATEELLQRGPSGLTMEGIALRAGVNKAIPYRHFENAQAVVVELLVRFNTIIGTRVLAAVRQHETIEDRVRATVTAYFDVVREHRAFLAVTFDRAPDSAERAAQEVGAQDFTTTLVVRSFGVPQRDARLVGEVLQGILASSARAWTTRQTSRKRIEAFAYAACAAVIADAST